MSSCGIARRVATLWHCTTCRGIVHRAMALCIVPRPCASCHCIAHRPGTMRIIPKQCASPRNDAHRSRAMRIIPGRCASFRGDAKCNGTMRNCPERCASFGGVTGLCASKRGAGLGCYASKKGSCASKKRGITHRARCWRSRRATALADGNLLSSFVAEKNKIKMPQIASAGSVGGAEKKTIHLCSVSSGGGQQFYLCSRDGTAGGNLHNSLA